MEQIVDEEEIDNAVADMKARKHFRPKEGQQMRKIYGMRHCESPIGLQALLHTLKLPVTIVRKKKIRKDKYQHSNKKARWWHELWADPDVLEELETQWLKIPALRSLRLEQ